MNIKILTVLGLSLMSTHVLSEDIRVVRGSITDYPFEGKIVDVTSAAVSEEFAVPNFKEHNARVRPAINTMTRQLLDLAKRHCEGSDTYALDNVHTDVRTIDFTNGLSVTVQSNIVCIDK